MRKILMLFASAFILFACNEETRTAGVTEEASRSNLAAAQKISAAFKTGDVSAIDSFVADNFIDHTPMGDKIGKDSLKAAVAFVHGNFPDMQSTTITEAANDNYVFQWMKYNGPDGSKMGMAPGPYEMKSLEITRYENGKLVEHWAYMDHVEAMKMSGGNPPAKPDTVKAISPAKK